MKKVSRDTVKGKAIIELQGLKTKVLTGVAIANTDIAVTGIKTADTIQSALLYTGGAPSDITSTVTITAAGKIRSSAITGAANQVVLSYWVSPL